jgi:acetyltransferase-like isoleucine patch superfamily enzyme
VRGDLEGELRLLHEELRAGAREAFDRDLPFEELVFDRWERAESLGFGEGASIYHNAYVFGDVVVGAGTWIGPFVMLDGSGGLKIGATCSISTGVHIYTHDTVRWALSGGAAEAERAPVRIGDCTYIGAQALVLKGVTIGDHCVVGAGAVVTGDVPPFTIVDGVPARARGRVVVDAQTGAIELVRDGGRP